MNIHEFNQGLLLGLMAMAGVFVVLTIIGLILYGFELLLYKKGEKEISAGGLIVESEGGIPKKVVAAIVSATSVHITGHMYVSSSDKMAIRIKRKKSSAYKKIKEKRWKDND